MKWWQFHPIIAPYPRDWIHEENMRKDAKAWMNMATDHIEQLEAALREIVELHHSEMEELVRSDKTYDIARAALGEKKDD